jgi:kinesin family member 5
MAENISVAVRFRPTNERENKLPKDDNFVLQILPQTSSVNIESNTFAYDNVFDENDGQELVFNKVAKNLVKWVIRGYNATIFAYGPSGTGKTLTIFGHESGNFEQRGIIPRSCDLLFEQLSKDTEIVCYDVKCSFLEIYREQIKDLLVQNQVSLKLRQNHIQGVYVQGLTEISVGSSEDILKAIDAGYQQRHTASTALNDVSSRSHAVLTLTITQSLKDGSNSWSKLHLIDLAGSENVGRSQAQGITLMEAQMINKSLSALGNVINALTEKNRDHIPYRDSRLTYLLQDSLGGNSKTSVICTATPHYSVKAETLNTLKFAQRTKLIKNIPKINKQESISSLQKQIEYLQLHLEEVRNKYEDSQQIIKIYTEAKKSEDEVECKVLNLKIEKLEKRLDKSIENYIEEKDRYDKLLVLFSKQRDICNNLGNELVQEKIKNINLENELEKYKRFYNTVKDINNVDARSMLIDKTDL